VAVDLHGTPDALQYDLNHPLPFAEKFDVVTNIGTGEHVFNQYQVFKSIHEHCSPSGLMIHALPNQGCYDHGFYNYHPTFVFDLCEANSYQILALILTDGTQKPKKLIKINSRDDYVQLAVDGKLSNYSGLHAILRQAYKPDEFRIPQQGYYDNKLPAELVSAWRRLPR
jgi:2-polyprenyl-3-methyl-5-hydroxy-6-metoxy-1,4-benzoquinol methylase